jgi:IMP dehydrogenase
MIEDPGTGEKRKIYRGMTSPQAVFEALYDDESTEAVTAALDVPAEGQEIQVPYKGTVVDILRRIRGHLRSAVSYGGAEELAQVRAQVTPDPLKYLIPLSEAGRRESYDR